MCQRCLPATGHAERVHKMCGCARKSAEHYFGQRKYGEHTIVLIVCRKKNIRAWWNSMKAKQLTHKQLTLRTYIHRYLNTYIPTYLPTYHHRPSITLILPLPFSLSVLRLSLKKLLTCGVIRSYNSVFFILIPFYCWRWYSLVASRYSFLVLPTMHLLRQFLSCSIYSPSFFSGCFLFWHGYSSIRAILRFSTPNSLNDFIERGLRFWGFVLFIWRKSTISSMFCHSLT